MPLFSDEQPKKRDWMDIALEFERESGGDWARAAQMATAAREAADKAGQPKDEDLAAAEHFLFSRHFSSQSPFHAASMMIGTPAYAAMKGLGLKPQATPPSWDQVRAGMGGALHGLMGRSD